MTEEIKEEEILKPLKVEITNPTIEKPEENPTSKDEDDLYDYTPTDEQIKEMTDAQ